MLTSLPDLSLAFFTLPYVPFPRVSRNSYLCFRLCLWWCLFTACFFTGTWHEAFSSGETPPTDGLQFAETRTKPSILTNLLISVVFAYFRRQGWLFNCIGSPGFCWSKVSYKGAQAQFRLKCKYELFLQRLLGRLLRLDDKDSDQTSTLKPARSVVPFVECWYLPAAHQDRSAGRTWGGHVTRPGGVSGQ